jgi:hypothetical protein
MTGISVLGFFSDPFAPTTTQFLTPGTFTITIPQGASLFTPELMGGGGGGGGSSTTVVGQGGGSGGRCVSNVSVAGHAGQTFILVVGTAVASTGVPGNSGQRGTDTTLTAGTFTGTFTTMDSTCGFGGSPSLGGGGGAGAASGGNLINGGGNASSGQTGGAGLTGTYVNGLSGATGANHPGSTSEPDTAGHAGQAAMHFQ